MYSELHARSAFSFLRAASLPEQLAETATQVHMPALALCDRGDSDQALRKINEALTLAQELAHPFSLG